MTFKDEFIRLTFAPDFSILGMELKREFQGERSIKGAIEMAVILNGVRRSLPFLLEGE
jgi:hypothetical protein